MWPLAAAPDPLDAPLPARQANRLFMVLLERLTKMQLDLTKLHEAIAQLRAETDAARSRQEAAHSAQLSDGQAEIDAAANEVLAIVKAQQDAAAPLPAAQPAASPVVSIPVAVPFAPNNEADVQTLLRAAMPGALAQDAIAPAAASGG